MKKSIYIRRVQLEFSEGVIFHVTNIQCHKRNIQESLCIHSLQALQCSELEHLNLSRALPSPALHPVNTNSGWGLVAPLDPSHHSLIPSFIVMAFMHVLLSLQRKLWQSSTWPSWPSQTHQVHYYFCVVISKKPSLNAQVELHGLQNTISLTPVFNLCTVWECFVPKSVSPK